MFKFIIIFQNLFVKNFLNKYQPILFQFKTKLIWIFKSFLFGRISKQYNLPLPHALSFLDSSVGKIFSILSVANDNTVLLVLSFIKFLFPIQFSQASTTESVLFSKIKSSASLSITNDTGNTENLARYFPLLMIKDFNSKGFSTYDDFMTNADVPVLAMNGLIDNPVNPFTGKVINSDEKTAHKKYLIRSD